MYSKKQIIELWAKENSAYKEKEIGSGVQLFVKKLLQCPEILNLKEGKLSTPDLERSNEFLEESTKKAKRADVIIYVNDQIVIPMEIERFGNIQAGEKQLFLYQLVWEKKTGILTDGNEWRFYIGKQCIKIFNLSTILEKTNEFLEFWNEYIKPINYYLNFFESTETIEDDLNIEENRQNFFTDITTLINSFKTKLQIKGYFKDISDKDAIELTYSYLIQFILYKTLSDNAFGEFKPDYNKRVLELKTNLKNQTYNSCLLVTKTISKLVSKNIYRPFKSEQAIISETVEDLLLKPQNTIDEISTWLDIFVFIKRYCFANIRNEIFGFIYENYLKQLYNENLGQYFTAPEVVDFMLEEIGYTGKELIENTNKNKISIIDPSCGSGTFLYSAVRNLIEALPTENKQNAENLEKLITENIFGIDIAEFPLYLAEMAIIMRMLPLILNEDYTNPLDKKIKVFKTKDSVAEFLDTSIKSTIYEKKKQENKNKGQLDFIDFGSLSFKSFIRDEDDLKELKQSLENHQELHLNRHRFDYVIGNPPYISYKECTQQKILSFQFMKEGKIKLSDIYGVNLHSIPEYSKKYAPNPNLYAFFIALALGLLKDGGQLAYIIPQTLLVAGDLDVLRYHLAKYTTIEKIYTFSSQMFIERGLKQNKTIITSSLIIFLKKEIPKPKHKVIFKHFTNQNKNIIEVLKGNYIENKISQSALLENVLNWNYLQQSKEFLNLYEKYKQNQTIEIYYKHSLAQEKFKSLFYFDRGLKFPKDKITNTITTEQKYFLPQINKERFTLKAKEEYILTNLLDFPFGSQGEEVYKAKYKIIWSYMNFQKFLFSDEPIMLDYNYILISSNDKKEVLYLFALLNSSISILILNKLLKIPNEQDILLGIKTIKEFIKVPIITAQNQALKTQIINLVQKLLDLETIKLLDLVDFNNVLIQKFDSLKIQDKYLILKHNDKITKCIIKNNIKLVQNFIEKYNNELNLKTLKNSILLDEKKQKEIKKQIDDLVFCLYFDEELSTLEESLFYQYLKE
jgi:Eco57I restriction-modification methylase